MTTSLYERVWKAHEDGSSEKKTAALEEVDATIADPVKRMVLHAMVIHEQPKPLSHRAGVTSVKEYVEKNSKLVRTNLAQMNVVVAFPDFLDGTDRGELDVLRPRKITIASPNYFKAEGNHTTNSRHALVKGYRLRTHRVIRGTTDPDVASRIARPEIEPIPNVMLVIGYEAVKAYARAVQEWANRYPNHAASAQKRDTLLAALGHELDALRELPLPQVSLG
ncbi:MAG TPA: hypothetical protein VD907_02135 [Verrucomicrobiae bacterium]|nr:hypothetical protein [Verrucomicrobiae bacterium]